MSKELPPISKSEAKRRRAMGDPRMVDVSAIVGNLEEEEGCAACGGPLDPDLDLFDQDYGGGIHRRCT